VHTPQAAFTVSAVNQRVVLEFAKYNVLWEHWLVILERASIMDAYTVVVRRHLVKCASAS
jgi:hypothetical protein